VLLASLAGCLGAGPDPAGSPPALTTTPAPVNAGAAPAASGTFGPGLELEVVYSGQWSGAYGTADAVHSDDGFGNKTLALPQGASRIQATFQKQETNEEPLTLRVVRDGAVLAEASGSTPIAVVTLVATPSPG
jgi:hypothetical protein